MTTLGMVQLLVGDFNGNGTVDAADYVLWRSAGNEHTAAERRVRRTPAVQPGDYDTWRANFGRTLGDRYGLSASVPEPSTWLLLADRPV